MLRKTMMEFLILQTQQFWKSGDRSPEEMMSKVRNPTPLLCLNTCVASSLMPHEIFPSAGQCRQNWQLLRVYLLETFVMLQTNAFTRDGLSVASGYLSKTQQKLLDRTLNSEVGIRTVCSEVRTTTMQFCLFRNKAKARR